MIRVRGKQRRRKYLHEAERLYTASASMILERQIIIIPCKLSEEVNTCLHMKYLTDKQLLSGFGLICAGFHFLSAK